MRAPPMALRNLQELRSAPEALSPRQRRILAIVFVLVAATRFFALSQSLADWDEANFCGGVHDFDVANDHPHAPGYPLYIIAGKAARLFTNSEFHALQGVTTLFAILLFPAAFLLARELRLRFWPALSSATLLLFLPTVWYFGGTALSDVPALCVSMFACALLLRGGRDPRMFLLGMFVAGLAAGIRSYSVLMTAAAGFVAFAAMRSLRTFLAGCAVAAAVVLACYGGAALASSDPPRGFIERVKHNSRHVRAVDSFHNPHRPPLAKLTEPFLIQPFAGGRAGRIVFWLAVAGLALMVLQRRLAALLIVAMFLPMAALTWVMLDLTSATRYAVAYLPMYTLCAAYAIGALRRLDWLIVPLGTALLVMHFVRWFWPTLQVVTRTDHPVVAAIHYARDQGRRVYLDNEFILHADHLLRGREYTLVYEEDQDLKEADYAPGHLYVLEGNAGQPGMRLFHRNEAMKMLQVARPRFFTVSVVPMNRYIRYRDGWYSNEYGGDTWWRWMQGSSKTLVPPLDGNGVLWLKLGVPIDAVRQATITVTWNGAVVDRVTTTKEEIELRYTLPSRAGAANELQLATSAVTNLAREGRGPDNRDLGLVLRGIDWR